MLAILPISLQADEQEASFLEALRQRRLFELAEKHSRDRLADRRLPAAERADQTVELIRTLALHALNSPPDRRAERWQAARKAASDFLAAGDAAPRSILVRVQDALTLLAQGELGRQENDVGVLSPTGKYQALAALRESSALLEAIDKELAQEIPLRRRTPPTGGDLTADELFALHQQVRQQSARALRNRALLYDAGSEDRLSLLLAAVQTLEQLVRELPAADALAGEARLQLATSKRLLGSADEARALLTEVEAGEYDAALREQAVAERIRLELAAGRRAQAVKLLEQLPSAAQSPDLDLLRLEIELDKLRALQADPKSPERRQAEQAIEALAQAITQRHGPYWGRRADQLVANLLASSSGTAGAAILSRAADSLYLKGEFNQAIAAYEQAAARASDAADPDAAFQLRYKAALVQQQRREHADAARRLRDLAVELRTHDKADQAHLLAAWNAAQAARADAAALKLYDQLLEEHAALWPMGDSLGQAQLWLGQLRESQRRPLEAARAYSRVPGNSEHFAAAVEGAARTWKQALATNRGDGDVNRDQLAQAVAYFTAAAALDEDRQQPLSETQRLSALTAAELLLDFGDAQAAEAEALLRVAIDRSPDAPQPWLGVAKARLVVALAAQPAKRREAEQLLQQAADASADQLLQMAAGLAEVLRHATPAEQPVVATLLLQAIDLLAPERSKLDRAAQVRLDQIHADALLAAGRAPEALRLVERLARENPDSAEIQERHATLLVDSSDPQSLRAGLDAWRKIAARSKPRTERWLRAKYSVALAQFRLGEVEAATTLLRYMLETPPGLKGTAWEERYETLLARCRQAGGEGK